MSRNFGRNSSEDGTPFGRIFGAVLLAMIVYGLLKLAVVSLMAKAAVDQFQQSVSEVERQAPHVVDRSPSSGNYAPESSQLPSYPGPIQAKRQGEWKACVNRRVTLRVEGGWEQTNAPCNAYSE